MPITSARSISTNRFFWFQGRRQSRHRFFSLFSLAAASSLLFDTSNSLTPLRSFNHRHNLHRGQHLQHLSVQRQPTEMKTSVHSSSSSSHVSPRIQETLDPCVVLMKELVGKYAHLWDDKNGIYSLAQGVVYWEPPPTCQESLIEELSSPSGNDLHMYGPAQGVPELVDALETKIKDENSLDDHSVMVTVGANQAYMNIVLTIMSESSKAVVFKPYYFNHVMAIQMCCGNDAVVVGPCSDDGIPDLLWLEDTLNNSESKIDTVSVVNPGNPTGVSLSRDYLQKVVNLCEKYDVWLILDCTYEYFTSPDLDHQPIATFPNSPNVIHIFSFSKSYSLAGYRCGYVCLPNKAKDQSLLSNMMKVQDTIPIGPPKISQIAAVGALKAGKRWVYDKYKTLDQSREVIFGSLKPLKLMGGTGAMYVMAQLPTAPNDKAIDDVEFCRQLVEEYGIAIIPGTYCGFPGWIRVCYANLQPGECAKAAERLRNGIQNILF